MLSSASHRATRGCRCDGDDVCRACKSVKESRVRPSRASAPRFSMSYTKREKCSRCNKRFALTENGLMRKHNTGHSPCDGSGQRPDRRPVEIASTTVAPPPDLVRRSADQEAEATTIVPTGLPCPVNGCPMMSASSMLLQHLERHCQGLFPGVVPASWLSIHNKFACPCGRLVAESRRESHKSTCYTHESQEHSTATEEVGRGFDSPLPTADEVMALNRPTLKRIPRRARRRFASILSEALKDVLSFNTVEAWTKLFMLPKCVLPSNKRAGKHQKQPDIEKFCERWANGQHVMLWHEALKTGSAPSGSRLKQRSQDAERALLCESAISLAQDGQFSKACRVLTSRGLAPNNPRTWQLLNDKHPAAEPPSVPATDTLPLHLGNRFDMRTVLSSFPTGTSCGPSGLRAQHLLDACEVTLQTPISSLLKQVVNILLRGGAPASLAPYIAGANLTALRKAVTDIRPIASGEILRRLTSKCACLEVREKAASFFRPWQFGVACPGGRESIVHRLRAVVDERWNENDFVILKVDMANAFNRVSRQAVVDACASRFPELLPWATFCYGQHPHLYHQMGRLRSQTGVQQGDPLGPLLFSLALQEILPSLDPQHHLVFQGWYLDDGVLCGPKTSIHDALRALQQSTSISGLEVNLSKCELYSKSPLDEFSTLIRRSSSPNLEILGAPIGDKKFCEAFIRDKRFAAKELLSLLPELENPQVALSLLRLCGSFCRLAHIARTTPPELAKPELQAFDEDVRDCFEKTSMVQCSSTAWDQAQLATSLGGFGLRSVATHSEAAYISSYCASALEKPSGVFTDACDAYNAKVKEQSTILATAALVNKPRQKTLSSAIEEAQYQSLTDRLCPADRARLGSITSSKTTSAWMWAIPSPALGQDLAPEEMNILVKWWLGLPVSSAGAICPRCPSPVALDLQGHHALTCKRGPDVVSRHNALRDCFHSFCRWAGLNPQREMGAGLGSSHHSQRRPADVLLPNWILGHDAAIDVTVVHPLNSEFLTGASTIGGGAAEVRAETKMEENSTKCRELGWRCVPMAVSVYGEWCDSGADTITRVASHLALQTRCRTAEARRTIITRLAVSLMRANARALLGHVPLTDLSK